MVKDLAVESKWVGCECETEAQREYQVFEHTVYLKKSSSNIFCQTLYLQQYT